MGEVARTTGDAGVGAGDRREALHRCLRVPVSRDVQGQQPREDHILVNRRRVRIVPAVGGPDGAVEGGVCD